MNKHNKRQKSSKKSANKQPAHVEISTKPYQAIHPKEVSRNCINREWFSFQKKSGQVDYAKWTDFFAEAPSLYPGLMDTTDPRFFDKKSPGVLVDHNRASNFLVAKVFPVSDPALSRENDGLYITIPEGKFKESFPPHQNNLALNIPCAIYVTYNWKENKIKEVSPIPDRSAKFNLVNKSSVQNELFNRDMTELYPHPMGSALDQEFLGYMKREQDIPPDRIGQYVKIGFSGGKLEFTLRCLPEGEETKLVSQRPSNPSDQRGNRGRDVVLTFERPEIRNHQSDETFRIFSSSCPLAKWRRTQDKSYSKRPGKLIGYTKQGPPGGIEDDYIYVIPKSRMQALNSKY